MILSNHCISLHERLGSSKSFAYPLSNGGWVWDSAFYPEKNNFLLSIWCILVPLCLLSFPSPSLQLRDMEGGARQLNAFLVHFQSISVHSVNFNLSNSLTLFSHFDTFFVDIAAVLLWLILLPPKVECSA